MARLDNIPPDVNGLAGHIESREILLPERPEKLLLTICNELWRAHDEGVLRTKKAECRQLLKLSDSPVQGHNNVGIYGGEKDFKRTGLLKHFTRCDGAWFHFSITVCTRAREGLLLVAYDFELCFLPQHVQEHHLPHFIRSDLNEPGHKTENHGLRSHIHPGHDDLIAPAPVMGPLEVLHMFLYGGLLPPPKLRRPNHTALIL
jgi:hypothetical protein